MSKNGGEKKVKGADVIDKGAGESRGEESLAPVDHSDAFLADPDALDFSDGQSLVASGLDSDELNKLLSEGFETEVYVKIPEGGRIAGYFLGRGTPVMMHNPQKPEEMRPVDTWRFRHHSVNAVMVIPSSAQLDGKVGCIPKGVLTIVQKTGQAQVASGRRVNNFMVLTNPNKRIDVSAYAESVITPPTPSAPSTPPAN